MDQNLNPNGMMNGVPPVQPIQPTQKKRVGPIIAILVIVLLLIIGALYFFGQDADTTPTAEDITSENVIRNESAITEDVDAQLESDLEMQLEDVEYSF